MSRKNKILASMMRLGNFTVASLARVAGENPRTVRTVMLRCKPGVFNMISVSPGKGRGGRWHVYGLTPEGKKHIELELSQAFSMPLPDHVGETPDGHDVLPLAVYAAEEEVRALSERLGGDPAVLEFALDLASRAVDLAKRDVAEMAFGEVPEVRQRLAVMEGQLAAYRNMLQPCGTAAAAAAGQALPAATALPAASHMAAISWHGSGSRDGASAYEVSVAPRHAAMADEGHDYRAAFQVEAGSGADWVSEFFSSPALPQSQPQHMQNYGEPVHVTAYREHSAHIFERISNALETIGGRVAEVLPGQLLIGPAMEDENSRVLAAFIEGGLNVILGVRADVKRIDASWFEQGGPAAEDSPVYIFLTVNSGGRMEDLQEAISRIQGVSTRGMKVIVLDQSGMHRKQFARAGITRAHYVPRAGKLGAPGLLRLLAQTVA